MTGRGDTRRPNAQLGVELRVERRASVGRTSAIGKLGGSPRLKGRLFIVQEDTAVLDGRRAVRASRRLNIEFGVSSCWNISPPIELIKKPCFSN